MIFDHKAGFEREIRKSCHKKAFKVKILCSYMKKEFRIVQALIFVILSFFFAWVLMLASNIKIFPETNTLFLYLVALGLWILFVVYIWLILQNARRGTKARTRN